MSTPPKLPAVLVAGGAANATLRACRPACRPCLVQAARAFLSLPFDALREQYARAVRIGIVERSLLGCGHFESALGALEQLSCGPFARRV